MILDPLLGRLSNLISVYQRINLQGAMFYLYNETRIQLIADNETGRNAMWDRCESQVGDNQKWIDAR